MQGGPAATDYTTALEFDPDWPETLDKFAFLLAACPENPLHNPTAARKLAQRATQLTANQLPEYVATLSFVHAITGNFSSAVVVAELALKRQKKISTHN